MKNSAFTDPPLTEINKIDLLDQCLRDEVSLFPFNCIYMASTLIIKYAFASIFLHVTWKADLIKYNYSNHIYINHFLEPSIISFKVQIKKFMALISPFFRKP